MNNLKFPVVAMGCLRSSFEQVPWIILAFQISPDTPYSIYHHLSHSRIDLQCTLSGFNGLQSAYHCYLRMSLHFSVLFYGGANCAFGQ